MTSVSWHGSIKIMTSYQMVGCHNCFYLKLLGTTIKLKNMKTSATCNQTRVMH